ncbi:MAG: PqiC family protein [Halioglobus sp.]
MTTHYLHLAWLLTLGMVLTGCGSSPPNNYYVLSAHEFATPGGGTPTLGVGPIEVPQYLSRTNLVFNDADNTLRVASLDLWAEPLSDGIQRVLVLNLAGLLNTQNVSFYPFHPKRVPEYGVKVNLLQLDANDKEALLTAEWLVYRAATDTAVQRRISRLQAPLQAAQPEQVAAAYSALLYQLSEIIAAAITADRAAGDDTAKPSQQ